jgi:hypothetical protein
LANPPSVKNNIPDIRLVLNKGKSEQAIPSSLHRQKLSQGIYSTHQPNRGKSPFPADEKQARVPSFLTKHQVVSFKLFSKITIFN